MRKEMYNLELLLAEALVMYQCNFGFVTVQDVSIVTCRMCSEAQRITVSKTFNLLLFSVYTFVYRGISQILC